MGENVVFGVEDVLEGDGFPGRAGDGEVGEQDACLTAWELRSELATAELDGEPLIDARPRHLFLGDPGVANTGHIPGSRCLPHQELVDGATGVWAPPDAVRRLVRDAGIDPDRPPRELIVTCGSGVSATVALFSLERIGIHADGVYDGSFNEWSAVRAPVEYGSAR